MHFAWNRAGDTNQLTYTYKYLNASCLTMHFRVKGVAPSTIENVPVVYLMAYASVMSLKFGGTTVISIPVYDK